MFLSRMKHELMFHVSRRGKFDEACPEVAPALRRACDMSPRKSEEISRELRLIILVDHFGPAGKPAGFVIPADQALFGMKVDPVEPSP